MKAEGVFCLDNNYLSKDEIPTTFLPLRVAYALTILKMIFTQWGLLIFKLCDVRRTLDVSLLPRIDTDGHKRVEL